MKIRSWLKGIVAEAVAERLQPAPPIKVKDETYRSAAEARAQRIADLEVCVVRLGIETGYLPASAGRSGTLAYHADQIIDAYAKKPLGRYRGLRNVKGTAGDGI